MSSTPQDNRHAKVQWTVGAFLYVTAAVALISWLMFAWTITTEPGSGTFTIGTFTGSGLRDVLLATPTVLALVASQAVFGVGLMRRRPWVRWFGLAYVFAGLLTAALAPYFPPETLVTLLLPIPPAVPIGILVWRRQRGLLSENAPRDLLA